MDVRSQFAAAIINENAGESGRHFPTDFAPKPNEDRCHHCPSYVKSHAVKVIALLRPRWSYDNNGNRTARPNVVDFQPVCEDHSTTEYIDGLNNPAPSAPRAGRLRRNAR